ncbi:uridine kinase family protein [Baia soyae]|uniref:Uridine kinase n=1 Tax=Baia soyae TaxID=1544746 RepID=A0A4R2RS97_9BACL|nr:phosphoribulokinase [Baia soyae]TCP67100.1 uridine kinase [Baia soyae]
MELLLQQIVDRINTTNNRMIIGISGHGAAGKTTFAHKLISQLERDEVNYINTDPYIVGSNIRKHTRIQYTYQNVEHQDKMTACHPEAHFSTALERDIQMVRAGTDFYTIDAHYQRSERISSTKRVTIVEGMSMAFINLDLFDLKIYFYTDEQTELLRRMDRDVVERGTDLQYLKRSHDERRIQYQRFMHPYSKQFDIIVKNLNTEFRIEKNMG